MATDINFNYFLQSIRSYDNREMSCTLLFIFIWFIDLSSKIAWKMTNFPSFSFHSHIHSSKFAQIIFLLTNTDDEICFRFRTNQHTSSKWIYSRQPSQMWPKKFVNRMRSGKTSKQSDTQWFHDKVSSKEVHVPLYPKYSCFVSF